MSRTHPSSHDIIAMTNRVSHCTMHNRWNQGLVVTTLELAQAESNAARQVNATVDALWREEKCSHAQREKPAHSIQPIMENFNSFCVTSGNSKINAINNLLRDFKVDMLCGCKTQVDWRMVPQDQRFHKLFGAGSERRSAVAHNTNERMRPNWYGGCAMMALGTLSPKVVVFGIDFTRLGRWCLIHLGSGTKKTWIVMACPPSNFRRSAGTTIKNQHSRYCRALGDARLPWTIFFEQLVSQLITARCMALPLIHYTCSG